MSAAKHLTTASSYGATLSPCGRYRYRLWRGWQATMTSRLGHVLWIMCNPSEADEDRDDPTLDSILRISAAWGFTGLDVVNLWAWRSSRVEDLLTVGSPVGPDNDHHIEAAVCNATRIVLAWGSHKPIATMLAARSEVVLAQIQLAMAEQFVFELGVLGSNADGTPKHPLFQRATTPFIPIAMET